MMMMSNDPPPPYDHLGGQPRAPAGPEVAGGRDAAPPPRRRDAAIAIIGEAGYPESARMLSALAKQHTCSVCILIVLWLLMDIIIRSCFELYNSDNLQSNTAFVFRSIKHAFNVSSATDKGKH